MAKTETKAVICVACPLGCHVQVTMEGGRPVKALGAQCRKGLEYAAQEIQDPVRVLATTVPVTGGILPLLPVRTEGPVPRRMLRACMLALAQCRVQAPVRAGQIILENIAGTGVRVIASRDLPRLSSGL